MLMDSFGVVYVFLCMVGTHVCLWAVLVLCMCVFVYGGDTYMFVDSFGAVYVCLCMVGTHAYLCTVLVVFLRHHLTFFS